MTWSRLDSETNAAGASGHPHVLLIWIWSFGVLAFNVLVDVISVDEAVNAVLDRLGLKNKVSHYKSTYEDNYFSPHDIPP